MTEWQPIATAPRDGTNILTYGLGGIQIEKWDTDEYARKPRPFWRCYARNSTDNRMAQPTHWLPLPDPPVTP